MYNLNLALSLEQVETIERAVMIYANTLKDYDEETQEKEKAIILSIIKKINND